MSRTNTSRDLSQSWISTFRGNIGGYMLALTVLFGLPLALRSPAQASETLSTASAHPECSHLRGTDFSATRDAPFKVTSAEVSSEGGGNPYCKITGYIMPEITFDLRLPLTNWNHKFLLVGSGGYANHKFTFLCKPAISRGYACIAGDAGHQTPYGLWWQSDPRTMIDWGYLATHKTTIAGKALAKAFYGQDPELSLMMGCSTGGYQALVEAQRFPWDYNGIIADSPDLDEGDLNMRTIWAARSFTGNDGRPLFTTSDLEVLHQAALKACDMSDGVRDGIIGDPIACRFDPGTVECTGDKATDCLSQRQVLAARRIYGGPMTSKGERISTAGPFPGSEMGWPDFLEDVSFSNDLFRFALGELPRDGVSAAKFDFDEDYKRLGLLGTFIDDNPDLRRFEQAGGKLMLIQGGNDVTEQAHATIDYYQMVERVSGGAQAAQKFARLFIVPGMNHCSGGDGAFAIDYLSAMEKWAGGGPAPQRLVGAHVPDWEKGDTAVEAGLTSPPPGMRVTFTRPAYPYPLYTKYSGHGDVNDAASFEPAVTK